jgi:hypothetical protein
VLSQITTNCVKPNMGITGWFETKCGVRQGSILSPIVFNAVMNKICLKMKEKTGDFKALVYADDVMIWDNKIKVLEDKVNEWNGTGYSRKYGNTETINNLL